MGEYGVYILPAYALTALVIVGLAIDTAVRARRWRREVARLEAELKR